ncbi:MAG TPA: carbohydrate ABC transporter permease [candidate division Zixibacteria bacterium]|nr:carbohydrate ABC transporter permease [candidate division Zixibacteria bacterium]
MREEKVKTILIAAGVVLMLSFCLAPFFFMIVTSLSKNPEFLSPAADYQFTLQNYSSVIFKESLHFIDYLRNSIIVSGVAAVAGVLTASIAAFAIARFELPGKMLVLFFALAVSMFPQISIVGYLFKFMTWMGWINSYFALIFPYVAWVLPLSLWILTSYFSQIPKELDRAAYVDGCSRLKVLTRVIMPVAMPAILSTVLLAFIFAFNEFMFALILTSDHHARTVPVGIALFQGLHGEIPWGDIMAASAVTTLPVVILTIIFQRRIIAGLTRGAVKG